MSPFLSSIQLNEEGIYFILPEIILVLFFVVMLGSGLYFKKRAAVYFPAITLLALVCAAFLNTLYYLDFLSTSKRIVLFNELLQLHSGILFVKLLIYFASVFLVLQVMLIKKHTIPSLSWEFYPLFLMIPLGLCLLGMSTHWLMLFAALEMVSIVSYLLTAFAQDKRSAEAALKYLLFGAASSGLMLFGISLLYGCTGTLQINDEFFVRLFERGDWLPVVALILSFSGLFFKVSAFPFHYWAPDVYLGARPALAAYFSTAPKAAALMVLYMLMQPLIVAMVSHTTLLWILTLVSLITMTLGNFAALRQQNIMRLLAYSSIGHTGLMLAALTCPGTQTALNLGYYLCFYIPATLLAFFLAEYFSLQTGSGDVNNFKGLGTQVPYLTFIFVIVMVALTGLPPTAGFFAKLFIFTALLNSYQALGELPYLLLLIWALVNTLVSLFYYLKVPYLAYFKKYESQENITYLPKSAYILVTLVALWLVYLFVQADYVLPWITRF